MTTVLRVGAVGLAFAALVYVSDRAGVPDELPGAALGWNLLFHLVRAAAVLGTCGIVLLVGWRAMHGEFPIKFGNVEYAVKEAADKAEEATEAQERRIRYLEAVVFDVPPPPPQ